MLRFPFIEDCNRHQNKATVTRHDITTNILNSSCSMTTSIPASSINKSNNHGHCTSCQKDRSCNAWWVSLWQMTNRLTVLHIVSSCPRTAAASLSLRVNVLCPNQHKQVISETFFPANLMASIEETKPNTPKANIHSEHKNITTQNKHKKLKGLVSSGPTQGAAASVAAQWLMAFCECTRQQQNCHHYQTDCPFTTNCCIFLISMQTSPFSQRYLWSHAIFNPSFSDHCSMIN